MLENYWISDKLVVSEKKSTIRISVSKSELALSFFLTLRNEPSVKARQNNRISQKFGANHFKKKRLSLISKAKK